MSNTPRIKYPRSNDRSSRNTPHCVVNLSIQFPTKSKFAFTHRSNQVSAVPSPNKIKKKYKLSVTPIHQKKTMPSSNHNTLRDLPYWDSMTFNKKKNMMQQVNKKERAFHNKIKSCEISPKKRKYETKKGKQTHRIIRNISILDRVESEEDNMIKYTSNSSEIKNQPKESFLSDQESEKFIPSLVSEDINLSEIRSFQEQASTKKQHIHYLYLKEQIFFLASVKKIQRAWRNYKTRKLVKSYSNDIRKKFTKNVSDSAFKINQSKSVTTGFKFKKFSIQTEQIKAQNNKDNKISQKFKQFQQQEIQKWEQLIHQIKNNKNIEDVLQNSERRRKQLKEEITHQKKIIIKSKNYYKSEENKVSQLKKIEKRVISQEQQTQRIKKIILFENQILKIDNDEFRSVQVIQSQEEISPTQEEEQLKKIRKKLEVVNQHFKNQRQKEGKQTTSLHKNQRQHISEILKIKKKFDHCQKKQQSQSLEDERTLSRSSEGVLLSQIQEEKENPLQISPPAQTHRDYKGKKIDIQDDQEDKQQWIKRLGWQLNKQGSKVIQVIVEQLIIESLISFSESDRMIIQIKNLHNQMQKSAPNRKPEGIVTNLTSIRDYINNLINFLEQYGMLHLIESSLSTPIAEKPIDFLKYLRGEQVSFLGQESEFIMGIQIFNKHWEYANELIYFDQKFQDEEKEKQRVNLLKQFTKVFFRSIFDCFNQSLEIKRVYGLQGKALPWNKQKVTKTQNPKLRECFSFAFRRVLKISTSFCGVLFEDKQHSLDPFTISEIQQENMTKLLVSQVKMLQKRPNKNNIFGKTMFSKKQK